MARLKESAKFRLPGRRSPPPRLIPFGLPMVSRPPKRRSRLKHSRGNSQHKRNRPGVVFR